MQPDLLLFTYDLKSHVALLHVYTAMPLTNPNLTLTRVQSAWQRLHVNSHKSDHGH